MDGEDMKPSFEDYEALPDVPSAVFHVIRNQDSKFVDGHNRLRIEHDSMDRQIAIIQKQMEDHDMQLQNVAKRTTDIAQLRFTPSTVLALLVLCASIITGQVASTAGIRSEQAAMREEMSSIRALLSTQAKVAEVDAKLRDERDARITEAVKELKARAEMTDLKVNNLRESMLTRGR